MKIKILFLCLSVIITPILLRSERVQAADVTSAVSEISDLVTTVDTAASASDITSGDISSDDSDTMLSDANDYNSGDTDGLTSLVESLKETAITALTTGAAAVGMSSSTSEIISGDGYEEGQQEPLSWSDDVSTSIDVNNKETACVEYSFIGLCWWVKLSYPWGYGSKSAAENYVADLQVEIMSRPPSEDTSLFDEADNAPSDTASGAVIQNAGSIFGRVMDALYSNGPDLQWMENQSAEVDGDDTSANLFREAMVIGNPTTSLGYSAWEMLPGYCSTQVSEYSPYFLSTMDIFSWRILSTTDTVLLALYSLTKEKTWNEVGASMGSVYPRLGYSDSPEEFDTAVTMAYRAVSIVSDLRTGYSGIYGLHIGRATEAYADGSLENKSDMKYRTVRDHTSQLLRMTYPEEATTCTNYQSLSKAEKEEKNKMYGEDNKYRSSAFKVYRPYVCCKKKYQYVLTTVAVEPEFERY